MRFFLAALFLSACSLAHQNQDVGDAATLDAAVDDMTPMRCAPPMDVREDPCQSACAAPVVKYRWSGYDCISFDACHCEGADCARLYATLESCRADHATCESTLCRATGGVWMAEPWYTEPTRCGVLPRPDRLGRPACHCGLGKTFDDVRGCVENEACDDEQTCIATGGYWRRECGSIDVCGWFSPSNEACTASGTCDCWPGYRYDGRTVGCVDIEEEYRAAGCTDPGVDSPPPIVDASGEHFSSCASTGGEPLLVSTGQLLCDPIDYWPEEQTPSCDCGYGSPVRQGWFARSCARASETCTGYNFEGPIDPIGYEGQPCFGSFYGEHHACQGRLVCVAGVCEQPMCVQAAP